MSGIDRAVYESAHDFPGGIEALATLLGKATGTVYNKADPGMEHQFTLKEVVSLMKFAGDFRIAEAVCREIDHAAIPYGDYRNCSDVELLDCVLNVNREDGETAAAIGKALADGVIDAAEGASLDREIAEDIEARLALRDRLRGLRRG